MQRIVYEVDGLRFEPADGLLTSADESVRLRPQAARLLQGLVERAGELVDRDTLVARIWGDDTVVDFEAGLAALVREVRQALAQVGADNASVETLPRRGYRLHASVRRLEQPSGTRPDAAAPWRWPTLFAVSLAVLVVVLAVWRGLPLSHDGPPYSLALLPLDAPAAADERIGILLADHLLAELWRADLEGLQLVGRAGMRPYAGRENVAGAVARDLDVDLLIEGSFSTAADGWRIDARLLATPGGRIVWSGTLGGDEFPLPHAMAADRLADSLVADWPAIRDRLERR